MANKFLNPRSPVLGRIGEMETRLARSEEEIQAAQRLRYHVFYEELEASGQAQQPSQLDTDPYDEYCDHLLVLDAKEIVGTYRLLPGSRAAKEGGYYSAQEYELAPLLTANQDKRLMELGRSCILKAYRNKRTMELLWAGTWAYAVQEKIDVMFGCASFQGTNIEKHQASMNWLSQNATLDDAEDCAAHHPAFDDLSKFQKAPTPDERRAIAGLPPLLKGYLRLGAKVASDFVIDREFRTIDVLVVLKVLEINPRYIAHYGADASRFAASQQ